MTAPPYTASPAQLAHRLSYPTLAGVVPMWRTLAVDGDHRATLTVASDAAVDEWATYLANNGRVETAPFADVDGARTAIVVWDGWTVTVVCPDPAAAAHAALRRAVDRCRAARSEVTS